MIGTIAKRVHKHPDFTMSMLQSNVLVCDLIPESVALVSTLLKANLCNNDILIKAFEAVENLGCHMCLQRCSQIKIQFSELQH